MLGIFCHIPTFQRSTYFYVTITGELERFQYSNNEISCLKKEILFQKTGLQYFS